VYSNWPGKMHTKIIHHPSDLFTWKKKYSNDQTAHMIISSQGLFYWIKAFRPIDCGAEVKAYF
jgi:hypothetical protein